MRTVVLGSWWIIGSLACFLARGHAAGGFYCLEDYKPIGIELDRVVIPGYKTLTSGQLARTCLDECNKTSECTAVYTEGVQAEGQPVCQLLHNTSTELPKRIHPISSSSRWPNVRANFLNSSYTPSLSWLCFKDVADWDALGSVSAEMQGLEPGAAWCGFGADLSGTNLIRYMNITDRSDYKQCGVLCQGTPECNFWVASPTKSSLSCWVKKDPFKAGHGTTGAYRGSSHGSTLPQDGLVMCTTKKELWEYYGLVLAPTLDTKEYGGIYYTMYPERVNFTQASSVCAALPGGQLAILNTNELMTNVAAPLLDTPKEGFGTVMAWVGLAGTYQNDTRPNSSSSPCHDLERGLLKPASVDSGNTTIVCTGSDYDLARIRWAGPQPLVSPLNLIAPQVVPYNAEWDPSIDNSTTPGYLPQGTARVCGRVFTQGPPLDDGYTAHLWIFDCARFAPFICQSTQPPPGEPLMTRPPSTPPDTTQQQTNRSNQAGTAAWIKPVIAISAVVGFALVLLLVGALVLQQVQGRLHEQLRVWRKRNMGPPKTGRMSIVVTDIEDYSSFMRSYPEETMQALLLHNHVIRRAAYDNVGYVLEQEGDSYILAFHDATDAAAFALQVQQALLQQPWPENITYKDGWDSRPLVKEGGKDRSTLTPQPDTILEEGGVALQPGPPGLASPEPCFVGIGGRSSASCPSLATATAAAHPSTGSGSGGNLGRQLQLNPSIARDTLNRGRSMSPRVIREAFGVAVVPEGGVRTASAVSRLAGMGSSRSMQPHKQQQQQQVRRPSSAEGAVLFRGLRVRVGLATGTVQPSEEIKDSAVYKLAHVVSDVANGGQVLMDEPSFAEVKECMRRLGAVHADGLDYSQLYNTSRPFSVWRTIFSCCGSRHNNRHQLQLSSSAAASSADDALVLDMGLYEMPSSGVPELQLLEPRGGLTQEGSKASQGSILSSGSSFKRAFSKVVLSFTSGNSNSRVGAEAARVEALIGGPCIRLYQVLAPSLVGRGLVFLNTLAIKEDWVCVDPPFFAAPGLEGGGVDPWLPLNHSKTQAVRRSSSSTSSGVSSWGPLSSVFSFDLKSTASSAIGPLASGQPRFGSVFGPIEESSVLSQVTIVFVVVAGREQLKVAHARHIRAIHTLVRDLMLKALMEVQGSYLVRAQDGELRYLLAFPSPTSAVEWCLMFQEAAMFLPYPPALLQDSGLKPQYDDEDRLVFRGLRFKMGLCEGTPRCVLPDHVGRADYHGSFVNTAARYADAAAHGGQIVTDAQLAGRIFNLWQANPSLAIALRNTSATTLGGAGSGAGPGPALSIGSREAGGRCSSFRVGSGSWRGGNSFFGGHSWGASGVLGGRTSSSRGDLGPVGSSSAERQGLGLAGFTPVSQPTAAHAGADDAPISRAWDQIPPTPAAAAGAAQAGTAGAAAAATATAVAAQGSGGVAGAPGRRKDLKPVGALSSGSQQLPVKGLGPMESPFTGDEAGEGPDPGTCCKVPVSLEVQWLGTWVFKGSPSPVEMVAFCPTLRSGRRFPPEAPKGKGVRLRTRQGLMGRALVHLPSTVCGYTLY